MLCRGTKLLADGPVHHARDRSGEEISRGDKQGLCVEPAVVGGAILYSADAAPDGPRGAERIGDTRERPRQVAMTAVQREVPGKGSRGRVDLALRRDVRQLTRSRLPPRQQ